MSASCVSDNLNDAAAHVRRDAFALTLNGKIDREALPLPAPSDHPARMHAPPEDDLERWLAGGTPGRAAGRP